jgi:hypothetical protein
LTLCAIAAAFPGKYLPAIRQQLTESIDILVINIRPALSAKPALRLLANTHSAFALHDLLFSACL